MLVAVGSVVLAGGAILLFALEGALCLVMAAPLGLVLAAMGALLGETCRARFDTAAGVSRPRAAAPALRRARRGPAAARSARS